MQGGNLPKPYLIRTPPYDQTSGGIKVMWGLYGWLLAKGLPAFVNTTINVPSIGIYPEIYHGNDMFATKVIRYILQKPGMMAIPDEFGVPRTGPTAFDPKDEIYVFSRIYDEWNVDDDHILFLPIIDLHTFKDLGGKRTKKAFYVGKGVNWGNHPKDAIEITRYTAQNQAELAEILNECEVLYVYDRVSAIMEVSRLCHCPVVYYGDLSKEQLSLYEPGLNGITYKDERKVKLDGNEFRNHYKNLIQEFERKLDIFIEETQKI